MTVFNKKKDVFMSVDDFTHQGESWVGVNNKGGANFVSLLGLFLRVKAGTIQFFDFIKGLRNKTTIITTFNKIVTV